MIHIHPWIAWHPHIFIPDYRLAAQRLLNNETWTTFVVLRDPLERLVSGFADKCMKDGWCEGNKTTDFRVFANRIVDKIEQGNVKDIGDHFAPQYTFCALEEYFEFYDNVIYFDKESIAEQTLSMMKDVGIEQMFFNWNGHQNETLFSLLPPQASKKHAGHSSAERGEFYSNYYDKEFANKIMNAFKKDYQILKFKKPEWIKYLKN